ncbi:MAG: DUF971 domain-containing protein [Pirellulaceae bacterium]|nr:DUF971 domain-containing protein [Pirellulaceae bacterium]
MNETPTPTNIEKLSDRLLAIDWDDGKRHEFPAQFLRDSCPCATCRTLARAKEEKESNEIGSGQNGKNLLTVLSPAELAPLSIVTMRPVGNYAYNIHFSDDHHSGLYTLVRLYELGEQELSKKDSK